jgi:hypothetical protein
MPLQYGADPSSGPSRHGGVLWIIHEQDRSATLRTNQKVGGEKYQNNMTVLSSPA